MQINKLKQEKIHSSKYMYRNKTNLWKRIKFALVMVINVHLRLLASLNCNVHSRINPLIYLGRQRIEVLDDQTKPIHKKAKR